MVSVANLKPVVLAVGVILLHGLGAWALVAATHSASATTPVYVHLSAQILETNNPSMVGGSPTPRVTERVLIEDFSQHLTLLPTAPAIVLAGTNESATRSAPRPLDGAQPPIRPYAQRAGLLDGESAYVVLRILVLAAGTVGDVAVDVSSGSRQVDQSAMDYARVMRWIPGRTGDAEEPTWVRMGIRLAA